MNIQIFLSSCTGSSFVWIQVRTDHRRKVWSQPIFRVFPRRSPWLKSTPSSESSCTQSVCSAYLKLTSSLAFNKWICIHTRILLKSCSRCSNRLVTVETWIYSGASRINRSDTDSQWMLRMKRIIVKYFRCMDSTLSSWRNKLSTRITNTLTNFIYK